VTRAQSAPADEADPGAIDEFLHTPARLGVLSLLAPADWVRFSFLRDTLGTSASALSKQLSTLQEAGYVETRRDGGAGRGISVRLTSSGRAAFDRYLRSLELLVARARGSHGEAAGAAVVPDRG
jgi:DNA-binding MarR family transcriptional regulator